MANPNYIRTSFLWGTTSKLLDAIVKFISVPLLLSYYGRDNFGLIALATSINAYLQILDLGVNTGSIKFFSEWIFQKQIKRLDTVARTSITFYGAIGVLNTIILLLIAFFGLHWFSLSKVDTEVFKNLLLILAAVATINWSGSVFNQLLTANENIAYIQKLNIIKSIAGLLVVYLTLYYKFSIAEYFSLFILVNTFTIFPSYLKAKKSGLISSLWPTFDWINFKPIFKYSLAIIVMGLFQMTATKMRPIVLGIFSNDGVGLISDYRIMETITIFIISIGGMFVSILLPKSSKLLLENNAVKTASFAYKNTLYTSIICTVLCMPFLLNSKEVLTVYVGEEFAYLSIWLNVWIVTILLYLHNSPVSSLVLASGKTKMLVYSSAIACTVSLIINAVFVNFLNVGSAVLGYSVYIVIQMSFYYFYFNNKVLGLNSFKVFKSFIIPTGFAVLGMLPLWIINLNLIENVYLLMLIKTISWFTLYIFLLILFKIVKIEDIINSIAKKTS